MSWVQLQFSISKKQQKALENALSKCGALSLTYQDAADQPILEPELYQTPLWDDILLTALFEAPIDAKKILAQCEQFFGQTLPKHKVEILEDKDWVREWMDSYQPLQMADKLWICPSWCEPIDKKAVNILLDPGLAFGTGTHPTTAMCLQRLAAIDCQNKTVIDYGCGSGILAVAALLLGAKSAVGIDIDPQAIAASRENAQRNQIDDERFNLYLPQNMPTIEAADIVVANILAGPLVELSSDIVRMVKLGGVLILSGLLGEQEKNILQAYQQIQFSASMHTEEWLCMQGIKV